MTPALLVALALLQAEPAVAAPAVAAPDAAVAAPAITPLPAAEPAPTPAPLAPAPAPAAPDTAQPQAAAPAEPIVPAPPASAEPAAAAAPGGAPASEPAAAAAEAVPPPPPPPEPTPVDAAGATPAAAALAAAGAEARPDAKGADAPTRWGITLDGGFPDAAGLGVIFRPWHWLRLEAGGTTTVYASHGYRAGVSLVPFHFPITPALTLNYGRALEANWNRLLGKFGTPDPDLEPVLRRFGYQYVDAHVGLEIGAPRRFVFFVRAGLTQIWTKVHNLSAAATAQITDATTSATISDTRITARVPSAKIGFLVYFF